MRAKRARRGGDAKSEGSAWQMNAERASREDQTSFGFGDRSSKRLRCLNPFRDDDFKVRQGLLICGSIGGAAWEFGRLGNKRLVFVTPVDDDLVSNLPHGSPAYT